MNWRHGRAILTLLLDSHAFVWFVNGNSRCSPTARAEIERAVVYVSAATSWEVTTKVRLGKWPEAEDLVASFHEVLRAFNFESLPISIEHGRIAGSLPGPHKDPFDRIFAAQSLVENMTLITADPAFRSFGTRTMW